MPFIASPFDGAQIHYLDYRPSLSPPPFQPIPSDTGINHTENSRPNHSDLTLVFLHGWPMSSAMYASDLMLPLSQSYGLRCIGIDRRGFGRSEWNGNCITKDESSSLGEEITFETFARDTVAVVRGLKPTLKGRFVFVGSSMACGESVLAFWESEWVRERCEGFIWLGPSLPYPIQTLSNPKAPSRELWDSILQGFRTARAPFVHASLPGVFGAQEGAPCGITMDPADVARFERMVDEADPLAVERCVLINTGKNFTEDLKRLGTEWVQTGRVRVLVVHGDHDQSMPFEAGSGLLKDIMGDKTDVKVYDNAAHGLYFTHREKVLEDILDFVGKGRDHKGSD